MPNETDCQQMAQVATSLFLRITLCITTFLCVICIPLGLMSLRRLYHSTRLHFNSKCVFITGTIFVLIHMTVRIILHGKDLLNYFGSWQSGCDIFPSRSRCELRFYYKLSAYVIEVTPFVMTVERFVATFRAQDYENRYKWFGAILNILHVSLGAVLVWVQYCNRSGDTIVYYCWSSSTGNRYSMNIPIFVVLISQIITIPSLLYLLKMNERYRERSLGACSALTQKYQIYENLRSITTFRLISTLTWIYVTYNASATYIIHFYLRDMPLANQFATIEIVHCLPFYYLVLSSLIVRENNKPHRQFIIKVDSYRSSYFNDLQHLFDDAFDKTNIRKLQGKVSQQPPLKI